jgi:hypothetical protein
VPSVCCVPEGRLFPADCNCCEVEFAQLCTCCPVALTPALNPSRSDVAVSFTAFCARVVTGCVFGGYE